MNPNIYHDKDGNITFVKDDIIAILGYGNQAKAQALNMRDSGLNVIIGTDDEAYKQRAVKNGFNPISISKAVKAGNHVFLLIEDDLMEEIFDEKIKRNLKENASLVFYSAYNITYNRIIAPNNVDILLISPRICGKGVRETFLNKRGLYSFVGVHQDVSGKARQNLLALAKAVGALSRAAVEVSFDQQTHLNLFSEQTYIYPFKIILMRSIFNLIMSGYPPEAIFVELLLSGEGSFTIEKGQDVGFIKQMNFHSQTSQYGQMSRAIKYRSTADETNEVLERILREIRDGTFAREWANEHRKNRLEAMRKIALTSNFTKIEENTRNNLKVSSMEISMNHPFPDEQQIIEDDELKQLIDKFEDFYGDFQY